jgi:hypothetical protein
MRSQYRERALRLLSTFGGAAGWKSGISPNFCNTICRGADILRTTTLSRASFAPADQPLAPSLLRVDDAETLRQRHCPRPLVYV